MSVERPLRAEYAALPRFVAPAAPRAELWRSLVGTVLIALIYAALLYGSLAALAVGMGEWRFSKMLYALVSASTPRGVLMLFATFLPMAIAAIFVTRMVHDRPAGTLFGPAPRVARDFLRVSLPLVALWIALLPLTTASPDVGKSLPLRQLLAWLPLALPLLALQITAEELVFRGYLLQQLAIRSRAPWIWMGLPSILFGALHYAPSEFGANAVWPALWAGIFGCLAADLTARTGSLGAAMGFHFATNVSAIFLVGLYGNLDGLSLYTVVINTRDASQLLPYLAIDFASILVAWLVARLMLRV